MPPLLLASRYLVPSRDNVISPKVARQEEKYHEALAALVESEHTAAVHPAVRLLHARRLGVRGVASAQQLSQEIRRSACHF